MAGIEHLTAGLVARCLTPRVSIRWLLFATVILDVLWAVFTFFGMERSLNLVLTHGLFMSVLWSFLGGLPVALLYKEFKSGLIFGLLIFSHWLLDFITHPMGLLTGDTVPNMPLLFADSPKVGLGLYNTVPGFLIGFTLLFVPGLVLSVLYIRKKLREWCVKSPE